jgi:hypothetical protein
MDFLQKPAGILHDRRLFYIFALLAFPVRVSGWNAWRRFGARATAKQNETEK